MKSTWIAIAALFISTAAVRAESSPAVNAPAESSIWNGLEIGVRSIHVELREDSRGTGTRERTDNFLGSIDMLDAEQDYAPTRVYLQYFFTDILGIGASYDKVEAQARDESASDGIVGADGPIFYLVARYLNDSTFTPFLEVGMAHYHAYFEENAEWSRNGLRYMDVESTEALVLALGCDIAVTEQLSVNLYTRLVDGATLDGKHFNSDDPVNPRQVGDFNIDYFGAGIGIKYAFQ